MENAVELISQKTTIGKIKNLISEVLDKTLIAELEAEGFFRKLK